MEMNAQLASFFMALAIGCILGCIFDFYRVMRGIFHFKMLMTMLMDGIYWLIAVAIAFTCLLFSNWAEMRFYILFGIIGGWVSYYKIVSASMVIFMLKSMRCLLAICLWIRRCIHFWLLRPLGYCCGIFLYPFHFGGRKLKRLVIFTKKKRMFQKKATKTTKMNP